MDCNVSGIKRSMLLKAECFLLLISKSLLLSQLSQAKQCWQRSKQPNAEYWLQTVDAHKVEALISNLQYLITIFNFNIRKGRRGRNLEFDRIVLGPPLSNCLQVIKHSSFLPTIVITFKTDSVCPVNAFL